MTERRPEVRARFALRQDCVDLLDAMAVVFAFVPSRATTLPKLLCP